MIFSYFFSYSMIYVCIVMSSYSIPIVHYCFADMVGFMTDVAQLDSVLAVEERNLLSVAYNNAIGDRRASWKILNSIEQKEEQKEDHPNTKLQLIKTYRETVSPQMSKGIWNLGRGTGGIEKPICNENYISSI